MEQHDELEALKPDATLHAAAARSMSSTGITLAKVSDQLVDIKRELRQMSQAFKAGMNPQRRGASPTKVDCRDFIRGRCFNSNCPRRHPTPPPNRHHAAVVCTLPVVTSPTTNAARSTPTEQAQAAAALTAVSALPWFPPASSGSPNSPHWYLTCRAQIFNQTFV